MSYYYNDEGDKVPVDDHSSPEAQQKAKEQWDRDHGPPSDYFGDLMRGLPQPSGGGQALPPAAAPPAKPTGQDGLPVGGGGDYNGPLPTAAQLAEETKQMGQQAEDEAARKAAEEAKYGHDTNYQYGGRFGKADADARYFGDQARWAQERRGEQIDYRAAQGWEKGGLDQHNAQVGMADIMRARALGLTPSIAGMVGDRQMRQAAAEQSSAAASARGPAALALAQQGAAANTANMQSNISQQTQINAANERMQAEQSAFGAYTGIRQGDAQNQQMAAQQAQAQAGINAAQRAQNDAWSGANYDREIGINTTQLQAQGNKEAAENGFFTNQRQLDQNASQHADDRSDRNTAMWLGGAGAALGAGGAVVGSIFGGSGKTANGGGQPSSSSGAATADGAVPPADGSLTPGTSGGSDGRGGYDDPLSDERAKNLTTWGNVQAQPAPDLAPSTWGTGPGTTDVDMAKLIARRALDEQTMREEGARGPHGPMAVSGVGALKRRDEEDYGLIQAKERAGADLTEREQATRASLRHRVMGDRRRAAARGGDAPKAEGNTAASIASVLGSVGGIGRAMASTPQVRSGGGVPLIAPHQQQLGGGKVYSDMTSKQPAPMPAVSADPAMQRASGYLQAQQAANAAQLNAGSSVGGALDRSNAPMYSDTDAKKAALISSVQQSQPQGAPLGMASMLGRRAIPQEPIQPQQRMAVGPPIRNIAARPMFSDEHAKQAVFDKAYTMGMRDAAAPQGEVSGVRAMAGERARPEAPAQVETSRGASIGDVVRSPHGERQMQSFTRGPANTPMANAARSMAGQPYTYKPEFAARSGQQPGEVNVGPMAQNMAADPVASTAVSNDPSTGMLTLERDKTLKVVASTVSEQQRQNDEQDQKISLMARLMRGMHR